MIIGIGIDVVSIKRFDKYAKNEKFLKKIFTENELNFCFKRKSKKTASLAARFSAKESFLKALNIGFSKGLILKDIELISEKSGNPKISLSGKAKDLYNKSSGNNILVSISHEEDYAISMVIIERN